MQDVVLSVAFPNLLIAISNLFQSLSKDQNITLKITYLLIFFLDFLSIKMMLKYTYTYLNSKAMSFQIG